ncbi:unnamed protein product [Amoebophrya sp. A120]|nr:unnamed protein product [Amoebophrya sp. A120]|eukprot:GSA120T00003009001.1
MFAGLGGKGQGKGQEDVPDLATILALLEGNDPASAAAQGSASAGADATASGSAAGSSPSAQGTMERPNVFRAMMQERCSAENMRILDVKETAGCVRDLQGGVLGHRGVDAQTGRGLRDIMRSSPLTDGPYAASRAQRDYIRDRVGGGDPLGNLLGGTSDAGLANIVSTVAGGLGTNMAEDGASLESILELDQRLEAITAAVKSAKTAMSAVVGLEALVVWRHEVSRLPGVEALQVADAANMLNRERMLGEDAHNDVAVEYAEVRCDQMRVRTALDGSKQVELKSVDGETAALLKGRIAHAFQTKYRGELGQLSNLKPGQIQLVSKQTVGGLLENQVMANATKFRLGAESDTPLVCDFDLTVSTDEAEAPKPNVMAFTRLQVKERETTRLALITVLGFYAKSICSTPSSASGSAASGAERAPSTGTGSTAASQVEPRVPEERFTKVIASGLAMLAYQRHVLLTHKAMATEGVQGLVVPADYSSPLANECHTAVHQYLTAREGTAASEEDHPTSPLRKKHKSQDLYELMCAELGEDAKARCSQMCGDVMGSMFAGSGEGGRQSILGSLMPQMAEMAGDGAPANAEFQQFMQDPMAMLRQVMPGFDNVMKDMMTAAAEGAHAEGGAARVMTDQACADALQKWRSLPENSEKFLCGMLEEEKEEGKVEK